MKTKSHRLGGQSGKPRILVVIRWPVGGIRTWCRYVYRDAGFESFDLAIFLPDMDEASTLRDDLKDSGINVITVKGITSTPGYLVAADLEILRGRYDLVHSHGFTSAVASWPSCRVSNTRHLVTPHDVVLEHQYKNLSGRIARRLIASALSSADCVQAVGSAAGDNLRQSFPGVFALDRKLLVVRNGIDTTRFLAATPEDVRIRYSIPNDAVIVGYFGRFMAQKGFRYLIDAVRQYRDRGFNLPLVVLAVGSGGFEREDKQAIQSLGLNHAFRFLGFSPNIGGLLKAVDVVAMPSLWEACPLLPMEALTAGVPIVVSDFKACVELAEGSPAKIVPMRDSTALLNGILEMSSPASKVAAQCYMHTAAARFDVAKTRQGILDLYGRLTGVTANAVASSSETL